MRRIETVFFDLDGTLLDGSGMRAAIVDVCAELAQLHPSLDSETLAMATAVAWEAYWPEVERGWALGTIHSDIVNHESWRRSLEACGCVDPAIVRAAADAYSRREAATHRLFEDVADTFAWIRAEGIRTAIITNGPSEPQRAKLELVGIADRFDALVLSGEVGYAKPDGEIFQHALDAVGADPTTTVHIGDLLSTDVAGAKAAGIGAFWLNRYSLPYDSAFPEPDRVVTTLRGLWED